MPELLLELFSEEIPARFQRRAADDLKKAVIDALVDGGLPWVRPIRAVTATFGSENEDPAIIPFGVGDVTSGQTTYGHRFLAPQPIKVRRFDDYVTSLERAKVVLDLDRRKDIIRADAD